MTDAMPNTIALEPARGVLVTGSNMSGKSTFLRTVGVNVILAQTIHTCLAAEYSAPVFNVRSCIGRADDLIAGGEQRSHVVIAATHDGELVDLLPDRFTAVHFGDEVGSDGILFDHRLKPGRATSRNAIALLRLHGAPERLLQDALACASALDRERTE